MPRTAKSDIGMALTSEKAPKVVIINNSTADGRFGLMFRVRPSLLKRARESVVGPMYVFLEQALIEYLDKLDAMPEGTLVTLNAAKFDPSPEDHELMASMPRLRNSGKRKKAKDAETDSDS